MQSLFTAIDNVTRSTRSVQKSFTMPEQIGNQRPVLKKSKVPLIIAGIFIAFYIIAQFAPFVFSFLR